MTSQNKTSNVSKCPTTWDAEYEMVSKTVERVSRDIDEFVLEYRFAEQTFNFEACSACLNELYDTLNYNEDSVRNCEEFLGVLRSKRLDADWEEKTAFGDLRKICKRAKIFENAAMTSKKRLLGRLRGHVYKYFLSFGEFSNGIHIALSDDLDEQYKAFKADIENKLSCVKENLGQYESIATPFAKFVSEGRKHEQIMDEVLKNLRGICDVLTKWIQRDKEYPEKLFDGMQQNRASVKRNTSDIRKLVNKRESLRAFLDRRVRARTQIDAKYEESRREKHRLATSTATVKVLIDKTTEEIEDKKKEVDSSGNASPRSSDTCTPSTVQYDIARLTDRLAFLKRQYKRTEQAYKHVSDRTYEHKMDVHTNEQQQTDTVAKIDKYDKDISELCEQIGAARSESDAMRVIRDMKLTNDTLRRIHLGRLDNAKPEKPVDKACHYIAENIGDDWVRLYGRLTFVPTRDGGKRERDIDTINWVAARHDQTAREQARVSLDKWRTFSRHGNVTQLLRSLRLIEKTDLAKQVERRFGQEIG